MRVVNTLVTSQVREPQVPQEEGDNRGNKPVALTAPIMEVDTGSQLLKDFMAFRPLVFHGGTDAAAVENQMLSIEKHLRSISYTDNRRV